MKDRFPNRTSAIRTAALLAGLAAGLPALAATMSMAKLPPEQSQGAVSYRTGGVGQDEARAMKRAARQYPLELEFISGRGKSHEAFLSDVNVSILDKAGHDVLQTKSDGPFLLARLPAGRYLVKANYKNAQRERHIAVPAHGTERVVLHW